MSGTGLIVLQAVAVLMILIGFVALYGAVRLYFRNKRAHLWRTVQGTITNASLEERMSRGGNRKRTKMYSADVRFTYEVDGKTYESDMVQLGATSESNVASGHAKRARKYTVGQKVKVYVDPHDPAMVTLEPGETGGIFNLAMLGLGFTAVGTIVIVMSIIAPRP